MLCCGPDPDLVLRNSGEDRKPGLHLSDITKRMVYERDRKYHPDSPLDAMVLDRGFTWERILERSLDDRHERKGYRPEQIQEDGIWISPDWISSDDVLEEWKATKKSSKRGFEDVGIHWLLNAKSYLRALLKRRLVKRWIIRFRIWWINGDYSYEPKTSDFHLLNDIWKVELEFDKRELDENWQTILTHAKKYGLLKDERWDSKTERKSPSPQPTPRPRKPESSSPQASAPAKVLKGMFRSTRRPASPHVA